MTLAIVDDDDDVRKALARLLRSMGHEVRVFASAEDFEAAIVVVDCAIVDVRLPGVSGIELRERLRRRLTPTPVVLITGDGDRLARDIASTLDTPLVTKPSEDSTLTAAITVAISTTDSVRERYAH
jgi:two-component system response regulator FixJ